MVRVTESQFADDVALHTRSRDCLESVAKKFVEGAREWGLTVSIEKMKGMAVEERDDENDVAPVQVDGGVIEMVEHFACLGSVMSRDGDIMEDVKWRTVKASRAFVCLRGPIFNNPILSIPTKRTVYKAIVLVLLMYGAER